jgi:ribonuclease I
MIDADIKAPTWWHYGCYWFNADQQIPESATLPPLNLPITLQTRLNEVMPLTQTHLDRHEYTKHISCFGPSPTQYFSTATQMIDVLNTSEFAQWMHGHRGQTVARAAIQTAFKQSFKQRDASEMQLRCASPTNSANKNILTEIWFTIPTQQLDQFPKPESFGPGLRGNCAAKIQILSE